ncbi:MAG: triose-phosphate isomerase [Gammaproteobacteria bacterium]
MRKPLVAGNWKMNGTLSTIDPLVYGIKSGITGLDGVEVAICPPFIYLEHVSSLLKESPILLGAQNASNKTEGAFTGEVSCEMLNDFGCHYVILGHSERRSLYGETSDLVAEKFIQTQAANLVPILCVGESLEERESGKMEGVISEQMREVLDKVGAEGFKQAVIAYEPVWAIGTGLTATPDQAQEVHSFIRDLVAEYEQRREVADQIRILYGGSVKPDNAAEIFAMKDIDGGLIGGAALKSKDFLGICQAAIV